MPVKCADCGYLGVRLVETRQLVDADEILRKTGGRTRVTYNRETIDEHPVCFARVEDFYEVMGPHPDNERRLHHIKQDRDCESFIQWWPGLSPKDHFDMDLLQQQRQWNKEESDRQRRWEADQAVLAANRHDQNMRIALATNKGNVWSNLVAGFIGGIAAIAAAVLAWLLTK